LLHHSCVAGAVAVLLAAGLGGCIDMTAMSGPSASRSPAPPPASAGDTVSAIYMHRTFRCVSCLMMEKMAREAVREDFASELASGKLRWAALNYDAYEGLTERYGLRISSLVLITYKDGREVSHEVLDDLWGLKMRPDAFRSRVVEAVRGRLAAAR